MKLPSLLATAALALGALTATAQAPGGITAGLKMWLKANGGVTVSTANLATQWNDLSGAGVTGAFTTANNQLSTPVQPPAYTAAGINFNPHIAFDRTVPNSLVSLNAFPGNSLLDPAANTVLQVIKLHTMTTTGVWLKWQFSNTSAYRLGDEVNPGSNGGKLRFDFPSGNLFSSGSIFDKYTLVNLTTATQKAIRLNGAQDAVSTATTTPFTPGTTPGRFSLGNEYTGDPYPTTIDIAEVIVFNRDLTAAERNKVESYLAVKYGFTLSQAAPAANDYTSSAGTVLWSATADAGYANNITGIGRDDASGLAQLQSRSINTGGLVTLYHGAYTGATMPALNINNTAAFTADNSFELIGDNGLAATFSQCYAGPPAAFQRMARVWKARETGGATGPVTLAVNTADVPTGTAHLMVSTSALFPPALTTIYKLDNSNGILSYTLPTLPDGSYFTFASDSLIAHASSNSPVCEGAEIHLFGNTSTGTYDWSGPIGFASAEQNPFISNAIAANSGTYTLGGSVNGCPLYPATLTVTVYPNPPVAFSVSKDACVGAPVYVDLTTPAAGITSFTWDFDGGTNLNGAVNEGPYQLGYSTPGVKHISLVSVAAGCPPHTTVDSTTVRALPQPQLIVSSPTVCPGDSISAYTAFQDISANYYWSPEPYFTYASPLDPRKIVYPTATGFIKVEAITAYGCKGTDSTLVTVVPCCEVPMPSAFTPNNDGHNDFFHPIGRRYHIAAFRIFNRWGQQVYESSHTAEDRGWDGAFEGAQQSTDTYYYLLNFQCEGGKYTTQKGDFMLVR